MIDYIKGGSYCENNSQKHSKKCKKICSKSNCISHDVSRRSYGTQKVLVKMTTGTYKGKEKQAINPSGTLFGADCKVGARTIWKSWCCINSTDHSIDRIISCSAQKINFIIHKINHKYGLWIL